MLQCHFLLDNYTDLIKVTEVCIYIAAEGVMMVKAIFMFYNQKLIRGVLEDLQTMANESKLTERELDNYIAMLIII